MPTTKSVIGRALFASAFFYAMLVFIFRDKPGPALITTFILTAVMIPLYMLLDRVIHRRRLKRWQTRNVKP